MSEQAALVTAYFVGIVALIGAIAKGTVAILAGLRENAEGIHDIHVATNSMKDELVKATKKASFAEGKVEGKAEQKAEG